MHLSSIHLILSHYVWVYKSIAITKILVSSESDRLDCNYQVVGQRDKALCRLNIFLTLISKKPKRTFEKPSFSTKIIDASPSIFVNTVNTHSRKISEDKKEQSRSIEISALSDHMLRVARSVVSNPCKTLTKRYAHYYPKTNLWKF